MRYTGGSQSTLLLKSPRSFIWHSTVTSVKLLRPFAPNFAIFIVYNYAHDKPKLWKIISYEKSLGKYLEQSKVDGPLCERGSQIFTIFQKNIWPIACFTVILPLL